MRNPVFTHRALRNKLGQFPTGVCVVTARAPGGAPIGLTINSFVPVSLEPPLVSWTFPSVPPAWTCSGRADISASAYSLVRRRRWHAGSPTRVSRTSSTVSPHGEG
ncbi:MAG TPA: flavin reductase family protein [Ottowia sp.]|uniref:flavin reductase family protein n=1 Tax=Ottowia sp. TaxID=1898956 RepID=UPI002BA2747F|nr:flavin reductase family protein [Ottowia sp.]HRN05271.1 flavin reductase family protein [Ottowia sp.]